MVGVISTSSETYLYPTKDGGYIGAGESLMACFESNTCFCCDVPYLTTHIPNTLTLQIVPMHDHFHTGVHTSFTRNHTHFQFTHSLSLVAVRSHCFTWRFWRLEEFSTDVVRGKTSIARVARVCYTTLLECGCVGAFRSHV